MRRGWDSVKRSPSLLTPPDYARRVPPAGGSRASRLRIPPLFRQKYSREKLRFSLVIFAVYFKNSSNVFRRRRWREWRAEIHAALPRTLTISSFFGGK